jgi:YidC/Oxa1 family membrane protein insertase
MDRKTVIAVVLMVAVFGIAFYVLPALFPQMKPAAALPPEKPATEQPAAEKPAQAAPAAGQPAAEAAPGQAAWQPGANVAAVLAPEIVEQSFTLDTKVYRVTFSNRGGVVTSIQLKNQNPDGSALEMVVSKGTGLYPFSLHFGDLSAPAVNDLFQVERAATGNEVTFYRTFLSSTGIPFEVRKTFRFQPEDYLIELRIAIKNSVNEYPEKYGDYAYTLDFGPQIGPPFETLRKANDARTYIYFAGGKRLEAKRFSKEGSLALQGQVTWAAVVGKYFQVIAAPDATSTVTYVNKPLEGLPERSSIFFSRPPIKSADTTKEPDVFRFYVGPNKPDILARYNNKEKNGFGLQGWHFDQSVPKGVLFWLAEVLRFLLEKFYWLIPNYGVAILLLTLLIKLVFWPLTDKSYQSTAKMQALQPKLKELQAKYKANPQKLNQEMAAMYKKEGVSPLGGCLPMLLQFPILIALYNLLSRHFDLRGASFIAGWISDLSVPESIVSFTPFTLPLLRQEISGLHLLPFLMTGMTVLQTKVSQTSAPTDKNMALMTYAMPVVFFFIMYNLPSGVVLYWTVQGVLGIAQQLLYNYRRKRKQEQGGEQTAVDRKRK